MTVVQCIKGNTGRFPVAAYSTSLSKITVIIMMMMIKMKNKEEWEGRRGKMEGERKGEEGRRGGAGKEKIES